MSDCDRDAQSANNLDPVVPQASPTPKNKFCKICKGRLKKFTKQKDWESRAYHKNCFQELVQDISHYSTRAYTKYNHVKRSTFGLTFEEHQKIKPKLTIHFD